MKDLKKLYKSQGKSNYRSRNWSGDSSMRLPRKRRLVRKSYGKNRSRMNLEIIQVKDDRVR